MLSFVYLTFIPGTVIMLLCRAVFILKVTINFIENFHPGNQTKIILRDFFLSGNPNLSFLNKTTVLVKCPQSKVMLAPPL